MGYIICPDGTSIQTDRIPGQQALIYEMLVREIKDEKWTPGWRAAAINIICEVGFRGEFAKDLVPYLHKLAAETEDVLLRDEANNALRKISANFSRA